MGISRRAYADHRGCSEAAVRKAIKTGRISVEPDGTIDPAKADAQWANRTDPAFQRGAHAPEGLIVPSPPAQDGAARPVPKAAIEAVRQTLEEEGDAGAAGDAGGSSIVKARTANEILKAQTARVRLQKMKGELVDRAKATTLFFDLARRERDAWLNWPPRVAALMAAELGVEAQAMEKVLEEHLRRHLAELAEVKIELR